ARAWRALCSTPACSISRRASHASPRARNARTSGWRCNVGMAEHYTVRGLESVSNFSRAEHELAKSSGKDSQRKQQERKAAARRREIAGSREEWRASAFEHALDQFDAAARRLRLTDNQIAMIKLPRRTTEVLLPVRMDDGTIRNFRAFRVQHNM